MEELSQLTNKKRVRDDLDESGLDSPEVKRLRDDLLGFLDDSDLCATTADLDSFMKSFAEEISVSPPVTVVDLTADSGEFQPDLGYLLGASDDELGLPPSTTTSSSEEVVELVRIPSASSDEIGDLWRLDEQIPSYDSFEYVFTADDDNYSCNNGAYVAFEGLFDYSDYLSSGFSGDSVTLWRSETMPHSNSGQMFR